MADTAVETAAYSGSNSSIVGIGGPHWISTSVGGVVYSNSTFDITARKTTDSGASWGSQIVLEAGTAAIMSSWFDRQQPGSSGTLIHVCYVESGALELKYAAFDINAGTWSSPVAITTGLTSVGPCFIAKTRAGGFVAGTVDVGVGGLAYKSADGVTWSSIASPWEVTTAADTTLGVSVNTGDSNDSGLLYWDGSADEISVKMYDDSGNSWTETAIGAAVENSGLMNWDAHTRLSDGHVIVGYWSEVDTATADLKVVDLTLDSIGSPTVTAKTDVLTDSAESVSVGVFIDQTNDDIYVVYLTGSAYQATINAYYKKSTDGGGTWGTQTAYGEDADDDLRNVYPGAMGATQGGRFQPMFFNDDLNDLFVNLTNDIEIAAAAGGDPEGSLIRGKLIRGGLLRGGVLVG